MTTVDGMPPSVWTDTRLLCRIATGALAGPVGRPGRCDPQQPIVVLDRRLADRRGEHPGLLEHHVGTFAHASEPIT